jgi:hypothetical protein
MLITIDVEDEAGHHQRGENGGDIEDAAEALPALSLWIEEYLLIGHR